MYADDDLPAAFLQDGTAYGDMATLDACLERFTIGLEIERTALAIDIALQPEHESAGSIVRIRTGLGACQKAENGPQKGEN